MMSAITYAELEYGVAASTNPGRERANPASLVEDIPVAPFDSAAAEAYGSIRQATRPHGRKPFCNGLTRRQPNDTSPQASH